MIYCARHLVEKAREHTCNIPIFMLFIDLRKAYDSIPRQAPPTMLSMICSSYEEMRAEVAVDGQVAPLHEFEVCSGRLCHCSNPFQPLCTSMR